MGQKLSSNQILSMIIGATLLLSSLFGGYVWAEKLTIATCEYQGDDCYITSNKPRTLNCISGGLKIGKFHIGRLHAIDIITKEPTTMS